LLSESQRKIIITQAKIIQKSWVRARLKIRERGVEGGEGGEEEAEEEEEEEGSGEELEGGENVLHLSPSLLSPSSISGQRNVAIPPPSYSEQQQLASLLQLPFCNKNKHAPRFIHHRRRKRKPSCRRSFPKGVRPSNQG
jgi:hypothetical protein